MSKGGAGSGMKKILILDTGKEWGGGTNSLLELLKRVDRKRYSFTALFYNNYAKGSSSDIKTELERLGVGFIKLEREDKKAYVKALKEVGRFFLSFTPGLKKKYVFFLDYMGRIVPDSKRIAAIIKEKGFDCLYMNNQPSSNLEGILAAKIANVPCVQHSRVDVTLNSFEADAVNKGVKKIICVSKGVAAGLIKSGVEERLCRVVYNAIDAAVKPGKDAKEVRKAAGIKPGEFVVGAVGSLIKRKRIELLIEAMGLLKGRDIKCLVVGSGPEEGSLKALASRLGVEDMVIFTGFSEDAISYINAMDVFVLPSEKEGLPRVILEAMLMGKPAIAFDIVGTGGLVIDNETGVLLKAGGAKEIAEPVKRLMDDRQLTEKMGGNARKRVVENFGIDKYINGVESVFEEVLK